MNFLYFSIFLILANPAACMDRQYIDDIPVKQTVFIDNMENMVSSLLTKFNSDQNVDGASEDTLNRSWKALSPNGNLVACVISRVRYRKKEKYFFPALIWDIRKDELQDIVEVPDQQKKICAFTPQSNLVFTDDFAKKNLFCNLTTMQSNNNVEKNCTFNNKETMTASFKMKRCVTRDESPGDFPEWIEGNIYYKKEPRVILKSFPKGDLIKEIVLPLKTPILHTDIAFNNQDSMLAMASDNQIFLNSMDSDDSWHICQDNVRFLKPSFSPSGTKLAVQVCLKTETEERNPYHFTKLFDLQTRREITTLNSPNLIASEQCAIFLNESIIAVLRFFEKQHTLELWPTDRSSENPLKIIRLPYEQFFDARDMGFDQISKILTILYSGQRTDKNYSLEAFSFDLNEIISNNS